MRRTSGCVLLALLISATIAGADGWDKFVAADGSFSLHYPSGWQVTQDDSSVTIDAADGRQIVMMAIPYSADRSAQLHAQMVLDLLAAAGPGLTVSDWRAEEDVAFARITFTEGGIARSGEIAAVKDPASRQALWFSYVGPTAGYDRALALDILPAVMASLTAGDGSRPPDETEAAVLSADDQRIVNAFLFTLEFSLGQPLDAESETSIARELVRGWQERGGSPEDLSMYPQLAQQIMSLDQEQLAGLQRDLHGVLREWLNANDPNDPAVGIVRARIEAGGRTVAVGDPALTAVAAQAYAEMFAMAELLHREPAAGLADIPPGVVREIRGQLIAAWPEFSAEQRQQILTAPNLWGVVRHALLLGADEQPARARAIIAGLIDVPAADEQPAAQAGEAPAGTAPTSAGAMTDQQLRAEMTRSYIAGETLRMMQQQTFNTWRWSMGYCNGPMGF